MVEFSDLPNELMPMITRELDAPELRSIRLVCKRLEQSSFDKFAAEHFTSLLVLPTPEALYRLHQIASYWRLKPYIDEVQFCSSVFRYSAYEEDANASSTRFCTDGIPFPVVSYRWQRYANQNVEYLTSDLFADHLRRAMSSLSIETLVIHNAYPELQPDGIFSIDGSLVIGRRRLLQDEGQDPLRMRGQSPVATWDLTQIHLHTKVCDRIVYAACITGQKLYRLVMGNVQPEFMPFMANPDQAFGGRFPLEDLRVLETAISVAEELYDISEAQISLSKFMNTLHELWHLSFESSEGPYSTIWNDNLLDIWQEMDMPFLNVFNAGLVVDEGVSAISAFLKSRKSSLHDLTVSFKLDDDDSASVALELFRLLENEFTGLNKIDIDYNLKVFTARGSDRVKRKLGQLIEYLVPDPSIWAHDTDQHEYMDADEDGDSDPEETTDQDVDSQDEEDTRVSKRPRVEL